MNQTDDLERRLAAWLGGQAPGREPDGLLDQVTRAVARTRRTPGWAIPERWIPVTMTLRLAAVPRALILLLGLALLLAALAAGGLVAGSLRDAMLSLPAPTGPARNGLIAYADLGDIWLADQLGEHRQQLTSGPDIDYVGAWSPDGTWLAYWSIAFDGDPADPIARNRARRQAGSVAIRLIHPGDAQPRTLASGLTWSSSDESALSWAPDSSALVYDYRASTGAEVIETRSIDGTPGRVLATYGVTPAWSPDGDTIAFVTNRFAADPDGVRGSGYGIETVAVAGGEPGPLSRARGNDEAFFRPQWSNDSSWILYHAGDIYVASADGSGESAVTSSPEAEWDPRWSPANDRIVFLRQAPDGMSVVLADADGTAEAVLGGLAASGQAPIWSPDGQRLLIGTHGEDGRPDGLAIVDVSGTTAPVQLAAQTVEMFGHAAWQRLAP
jgi:Tol biopolymer transport system component